jgi:MFS transporter, DHA2 family, multidrug resistance protein
MESKNIVNSRRYLLVLSMCFMAFIFNADYLAVNLAMQPIITEFHSSLETIQWILSGYMLIWSILVIPAGKLLERCSTKKVAIVGVSLFMLSSIFAGMSHHAVTIILSRMLQGGGAAIFLPACYTMMFNHFSENERGKVMGLISLAVGIGLALGPVLGGVLLEWYGWRSIFLINIPIALLVITIIYFFDNIPAPKLSEVKKLSKTSFLLLIFILPGLLLALSQYKLWSIHPQAYVGLITCVVFTYWIFMQLQKRINNPMIPFHIFQNKQFLACCLGIFFVEYNFSDIVVVFGLYLQNQVHLSSFESSLVFLAMTLFFGVIAVYSGRWTDQYGILKPVVSGLMILGVSCMLFPCIGHQNHLPWVYLLFMSMGLGAGLAFAALNAGIVKVVSAEYVGISSSIFLMITLIGNAVGVAVSTMIYLSFGMDTSLYLGGLLSLLATMGCYKLMRSDLVSSRLNANVSV